MWKGQCLSFYRDVERPAQIRCQKYLRPRKRSVSRATSFLRFRPPFLRFYLSFDTGVISRGLAVTLRHEIFTLARFDSCILASRPVSRQYEYE